MATNTSNSASHAVADSDQRNDQIQKFGLNKSNMDRFGGILRTINLEAIPIFASNVRQFGHHDTGIVSSETSSGSDSISCKIVDLPICGSFHIVFTLEFDDGVKWMLKIPANGHRFDSIAAAALTSEARTMQLLKRGTTIPVPAVYAFDASSCNDLKSPFILMERLEGKPLYVEWFNNEIPKARLEHFRVRALQSLAEAMTQLNKFTLNRGGALEFDPAGRPIGVRGAKVVDAVAMYSQGTGSKIESEADRDNAFNHNNHDAHETQNTANDNKLGSKSRNSDRDGKDVNENQEDDEIISEKGPFECPKSTFLFDLDRSIAYYKGKDGNEYINGCYKALRMFVDLAFSNSSIHGNRFVLTHPDLDIQNVLVADDGTLRGLIDWDGVASVPREIGCAQYPLWLMRDWVPYFYLYDIREGKTDEDAGYEESSPSELASYRAIYNHFMEKEIERRTGGPDKVTAFGTLPKQEAQLTRRSLVMRDLDLAASSPFLVANFLCHIFNQIEQVTEPGWENMDGDIVSNSSCSNEDIADSETKSDTNSHGREKDPETEATETYDDLSRRMITATSLNQDDEGAAIMERSNGFQISSEGQMESKKLEIGDSSKIDLKAVSSMSPTLLGWARELLCFGCTATEKVLRRIAKVGHVLKDGMNEVAEVWAELDIPHHDNVECHNKEETGQAIHSPGHPEVNKIEATKIMEPERPQHIYSDVGMVEPDQPRVIPDNMSVQDPIGQDHPIDFTSILPTIRLQDIPTRKTELIKAARARKRASFCAEKAKIKEELKLWEEIALMVRSHGISLEQLQGNQLKIARRVVDTLEADEKPENHLEDGSYLPPAAESAEQGAGQSKQAQASLIIARNRHASKQIRVRKGKNKLLAAKQDKASPELGNKDPSSSELRAQTTLRNVPVSLKQPEMPSNGEKLAGDLVLAQKTTTHANEATETPAKVLSALPSQPSSTPEDPWLPEEVLDSFQTLCSFGASCLKKIFSNHNRSEDCQGYLTPLSSVARSNDGDSNRSEAEESCKSSATSLSDDRAEFGKDVNIKENEDKESETRAIPTAERPDDEGDETGKNEEWADSEKNGAMENEVESDKGDSPNHEGDGQGKIARFSDDGEFRSRNVFMLLGMDKLDDIRLLRMQEGFLKLLEQY